MARDSIKKMLTSKEEIDRKAVTVSLNVSLLNKVDRVAKAFSIVNESKSFSRNSIIEAAIQDFIAESEEILLNEHNIDINEDDIIEDNIPFNFDLVIFPAHNDGFEKVFIKEKKWYSVRIKEEKISKIKYVACYRAAPVSGITHFAKVKSIGISPIEPDKKEITFEGEPIELKQPVNLGKTNANAMRSPRYTTLNKLHNATEIKDLF